MSKVGFIEKSVLGYYNLMSGKAGVRDKMFLDLEGFRNYDISSIKHKGKSISVRFTDYSKSSGDSDLKLKTHTSIFDVDYDCKKALKRLKNSFEFQFGMFILATDEDGNEITIGSADIVKYGSSYVMCNFGLIDEYKGLGFSKLCLYSVLSSLVDSGIKRMYLFVMRDNYKAIKLYESFGFERV